MKHILKGGLIISGDGCLEADILFEDEKIIKIAPELTAEDAEITDVTGKLIFPGFIDAHTHFDLDVAGTVTADGFETGTKAAVAGGTTMVIDFATQYAGETLKQGLQKWHKKADHKSSCDYGFHMAISEWNDAVAEEIKEMVSQGITSFKMYMTYDNMLDDKSIYQVIKKLKEYGCIAGVHCENKGIIDALVEEKKKAGHYEMSCHPKTRPAEAEAEAVNRLLNIAKVADAPIVVVHLSSEKGLEEIRHARANGQEIYVETCPQYLLLDDKVYDQEKSEAQKYFIAPPLRTKKDQNALWKALLNNEIQTISTDHCSFDLKQKSAGNEDFTKVPCGMPGVEDRPALMYNYGVKDHNLKIEMYCRLLSENPAKLYGIYPQKGCLKVGSDADIVVWDPDAHWQMKADEEYSLAGYHPYEGIQIQGKAEKVYLRGQLVAENGKVVKENSGKYVHRHVRD